MALASQDLSHDWGADLAVDATGDLLCAAGTLLGQQRVLRRLLTNPLDDMWHPGYGAGLPRFVGQPAAPLAIGALVRAQLRQEAAVAALPAPEVTVTAQPDGTVAAAISYADAASGATQGMSIPVGT